MTLSGQAIPFGLAVSDLAAQAGAAVVVPSTVQDKPISLDVTDADAERVLSDLANAVGLVVRFSDGVITFVEQDKAVLPFRVYRVGFEESEQAEAAFRSVCGGGAQVSRLGGRVLVAGTSEQLSRADELAEHFKSGADGWLLDVRVVNVSRSFRRELGLDFDLGAAIGGTMDAHTGNRPGTFPVFGVRARVVADLIATAVEQGRDAELVRTGSLLVLEGADQAELQQGEIIPVARRVVSDQGTVTVAGFDRVQTGFNLRASGRRVQGGMRLSLRPSLSNVTGFVEGAPITAESSISATVDVASGDWIVLSGLEGSDRSQTSRGVPGVPIDAERWDVAESSLVVLVRATRVSSSDMLREADR